MTDSVVRVVDVGSLPARRDPGGLSWTVSTAPTVESKLFEEVVVHCFVDKLSAGLDVATYPQFRDMCLMLLENLTGLVRLPEGYAVSGKMEPKIRGLPEVDLIRANAARIREATGREFQLRVCVTGPYTLLPYLMNPSMDDLMNLAEALGTIIEGCVFKDKHGQVEMLVLEEPLLGVVDDPRLGFSSDWREYLLKAWSMLLHLASSKGVLAGMHLHSTENRIFLDADSLRLLEIEADDPLYTSDKTAQMLDDHDMLLKASICVTDVNKLVEKLVLGAGEYSGLSPEERLGRAWDDLREGRLSAHSLIEDMGTMRKRLEKILDRYGMERVPYTGPECGLRGFPTYESAIECLRRCCEAAKEVSPR